MVDSDIPCPKCGKYDFWRIDTFLNRSGKTVTILAECKRCHRWFKQIKHLTRVSNSPTWKIKNSTTIEGGEE